MAGERIHSLIIPLERSALLVPSALVAEVVHPAPLTPVPLAAPWVLGVMSWRMRPVSVVSFDYLLDRSNAPPGPRSKLVVFYPLPGGHAWDFFAVQTAGEPQPRTFSEPESLASTVDPGSPYLAAALRLEKQTVGIPDLEALRALFYPD